MSLREFFIDRWEKEQPAFRKVLQALPPDQLAYKPHERSASAGGLAWQLAEEQRVLSTMVESGTLTWESRPVPASLEEIVAAWDAATEALRASFAALDDAKWGNKIDFAVGGQVVDTSSVQDYFWGFLLDMIHHRGQLSTYLRPMGGKVPQIYGPSGDEA
jgi:uncharacterized damage-inducible protein DinB